MGFRIQEGHSSSCLSKLKKRHKRHISVISFSPFFLMAPLQDILQNEGPGALFRGLESTLWRDVPFSAFYWLGVEAVRDRFLQHGALP